MTDPQFWEFFGQVLLETLTLFFLLVSLAGLLIPIYPGLVVMWGVTLVYALFQAAFGKMTWVDWFLFFLITLLMIGGSVVDNIIIAKHMREKEIPWSSILVSFATGIIVSMAFTPLAGIPASPTGLFFAEWYRLKDKKVAFHNAKAWMTGWGWSFAAQFIIGIFIILFWGLWAWL